MNYRMILYLSGQFLRILGALMILPLLYLLHIRLTVKHMILQE